MTAPADRRAGRLDADVADIIAVVLGTRRVPLDRPRRALALAAMNALGYSTKYMAGQLGVAPRSVPGLAGQLNVRLDRGRAFVDTRAVSWAVAGTPMLLRGNDLDAAVQQLHERGRTVAEIARLTRTTPTVIRERGRKLGLQLAEEPAEDRWWNRYYETTDAEEHR